jgi:hypothetical protein
MKKRTKIIICILTVVAISFGIIAARVQNVIDTSVQNIENKLESNTEISENEMKDFLNLVKENKNNTVIKNDLINFIADECERKPISDDSNIDYYLNVAPLLGTLISLYPDNLILKELNQTIDNYNKSIDDSNNSNSDSTDLDTEDVSTDNSNTDEGLELVSHDSVNGKIVGTIKNLTDKSYRYIEVDINLYDANGNQVGSTLANTTNLEGNSTWNFTAYINYDNTNTYKIVGIQGSR